MSITISGKGGNLNFCILWYLWFWSIFNRTWAVNTGLFICCQSICFCFVEKLTRWYFWLLFSKFSKKEKKCFACVRLSLEAGWSLISLWRIYDHVMKFDQSESPSSQQGIDAPCNYQRGKREENDGGGGAWSARYSLDIHYTVQKSFDLQYSIIETTLLIRSVLWSSWPKICKNENQNNRIQKCFTLLFSHNFLYFLAIQYFRII